MDLDDGHACILQCAFCYGKCIHPRPHRIDPAMLLGVDWQAVLQTCFRVADTLVGFHAAMHKPAKLTKRDRQREHSLVHHNGTGMPAEKTAMQASAPNRVQDTSAYLCYTIQCDIRTTSYSSSHVPHVSPMLYHGPFQIFEFNSPPRPEARISCSRCGTRPRRMQRAATGRVWRKV